MNDLLLLVYWMTLAGYGLLIRKLAADHTWKITPALMVYCVWSLGRSMVLFPLFYAGDEGYRAAYFWTKPVEILVIGLLCGEMCGRRWIGATFGFVAGSYEAAIFILPFQGWPPTPLWQMYLRSDEVTAWAIVAAATYAWWYGNRGIASGVLIATIFPALVPRVGGSFRWVSPASMVVAQAFWYFYTRALPAQLEPTDPNWLEKRINRPITMGRHHRELSRRVF